MILDIYARESEERRRGRRPRRTRNPSITGQHAACRTRVAEYGAQVGLALKDEGKSAWDPTVKRQDWERLITRAKSGESDGVVIFDIERLLRRVEDAVRIVKLAERGFLVIDSDAEYDLTTATGQKNFYEAAVAAQHYSHRLSTRVLRGLNLMIQDGEWFGGRWRMFGFEDDCTTVRESEAVYIREAVRRLLIGREPAKVVEWLQREVGDTTAGAPWTCTTLRRILVNPRIAGYIQRNGEIVGRLNGKPILEPTVWQEVVTFYEARSGRPATGAYLASGIVTHEGCGHTINGELQPKGNGKDYRRYEDGQRASRYYCSRQTGGCGRTIGDGRALDAHLKALVLDELSNPQHTTQLRARALEEAKSREPIEAEIDRLEKLRTHWGARLNAGKITIEYHDAMVDDVDAKIVVEEAKLSVLQDVPLPPPEHFYADALAAWEEAEPSERRELLKRTYAGHRISVISGPCRDTDFTQRLRVKAVRRGRG